MKSPEELAYDYGEKFDGVEISKNDINIAWYEGYEAAAPQWISVKDRLPDANQGWVTVYGANWGFRWMVQPGFYDVETKEWLSRFIRGDEEGYCALEAVSHWQELPEPPKEGE